MIELSSSQNLGFGMGFEHGFGGADEDGAGKRVEAGFIGGFFGLLASYIGAAAFGIVEAGLFWVTGFEVFSLRRCTFRRQRNDAT